MWDLPRKSNINIVIFNIVSVWFHHAQSFLPAALLYTVILHLRSLPLPPRCASSPWFRPARSALFFFTPGFIILLRSDCWGGFWLFFFSLLERKTLRSQSSAVTRSIFFSGKLLASVNNFGCWWDEEKKSHLALFQNSDFFFFECTSQQAKGQMRRFYSDPTAASRKSFGFAPQRRKISNSKTLLFFRVRFYIAATSVLQRTERRVKRRYVLHE